MLSQGKTPSRCRILLCEWQEIIPPLSQPRLALFFPKNQQSYCSVKLFLIFAPLAQVEAFHAATFFPRKMLLSYRHIILLCVATSFPCKKWPCSTRCWPQNYVTPTLPWQILQLSSAVAQPLVYVARPITAEADCPLCGTRTVRGLILSPASQFVSSAILPSQPGLCPALCRGPRRNVVSSLMYFEDQLEFVQVSTVWQCYLCLSRFYKTYSKRNSCGWTLHLLQSCGVVSLFGPVCNNVQTSLHISVSRFSAFICQFPRNRTNTKLCVKELISANLDNAEVEIQHPKESSEGWGSLPFKISLKFTWQVNPDRTERPPLQDAIKETLSQPLCQLNNKCSNSLRPRYVCTTMSRKCCLLSQQDHSYSKRQRQCGPPRSPNLQ
jgi:hypothetical protein